MTINNDKNQWKGLFVNVMGITCSFFSISPVDIAESFCDVSTVRKWLNGERLPNVSAQKHIIAYLMKAIHKKDNQYVYSVLINEIENNIPDLLRKDIKLLLDDSITDPAVYLVSILQLCFSRLKCNRNTGIHKPKHSL